MQKETKSLKVYGQKRNEAFKGVWWFNDSQYLHSREEWSDNTIYKLKYHSTTTSCSFKYKSKNLLWSKPVLTALWVKFFPNRYMMNG